MKKWLFLLWIFFFQAAMVSAQGLDPVEWKFASKKLDDKTYEVRISAEMEYPWHIYSQHTEDGGPLPTEIVFTDHPAVALEGEVKEEGSLMEKYEEVFMVDTRYYEGAVDFVQTVKVKKDTPQVLEGNVTFMACTDEQCLTPQQIRFNVRLN
ncbi:protein-disulfide reductase DsbD domain-containing protein [Sinomicrobium sp. M5D2P17]